MTAASPVRTPARALSAGIELGHGRDEVEARSHGAFRVVLGRRRSSPDRHDRVADELLDGAAVALDDRARGVEVAGEELARLLGVAALGDGRETHEVREEDGDEATLRCAWLMTRR